VKESLDIFFLGHFFGWWCKAMLFRHAGIILGGEHRLRADGAVVPALAAQLLRMQGGGRRCRSIERGCTASSEALLLLLLLLLPLTALQSQAAFHFAN
jgi:hypothetical protein